MFASPSRPESVPNVLPGPAGGRVIPMGSKAAAQLGPLGLRDGHLLGVRRDAIPELLDVEDLLRHAQFIEGLGWLGHPGLP